METEQLPKNNASFVTDTEEKETRELVKSSPEYAKIKAKNLDFMDMVRWNIMTKMAQSFISSGAMPAAIKNANQAIMVLQAGYEANLKPIEAINSFYFVNGKLAMYGEAVIRQVIKAGHKVTWGQYIDNDGKTAIKVVCNEKQAAVTITRSDTGERMGTKFTMDQAVARGYTTKNPVWAKFPENMLKYRAFSMTAKFICPDALQGIQIAEEVEAEVVGGKPIIEIKGPNKNEIAKKVIGSVTGHESLADVLNKPAENACEEKEKPSKKLSKKTKAETKDKEGKLI